MVFINLKRGMKDGKKFHTFTFNGMECIDPCDFLGVSNQLTGATNPEGFVDFGIFTYGQKDIKPNTAYVEFRYGDMRKMFEFKEINFDKDDVLTIEENLKDRVKQVKTWISSIDHMEELEFVVE